MATKSFSFTAFVKEFGQPEVVELKAFNALRFVDEAGNTTYVNPPKGGEALSLVDFSDADALAADIAENYNSLDILQGNKWVEEDNDYTGSVVYTLVDHTDAPSARVIKIDIK